MTPSVTLTDDAALPDIVGSVPEQGEQAVRKRTKALFPRVKQDFPLTLNQRVLGSSPRRGSAS